MSTELRQFLVAWLAWVDAGAETEQFSRGCGLCKNLWHKWLGLTDISAHPLRAELCDLLPDALPFNEGNYADECDSKRCHLNQRRVAWVRKKLNEKHPD